jgi:FMNH2-dependent dimethyl sulfone monooxygenase
MPVAFETVRRVATTADAAGFHTILVPELNLNDIKGPDEPCLEAWTTLAALVPLTKRIRWMAAVRPGFRLPAVVAKESANLDLISGGRFELNLVSAWWKEEMEMYAGEWMPHESRYKRSKEFLAVLQGLWSHERFSLEGEFYTLKNALLAPKPLQRTFLGTSGVPVYAGGESEEGRAWIASHCDGYLMHGDKEDSIAAAIADMDARRSRLELPRLSYGMAAYALCRSTEAEAQQELARITNVRASAKSQHSYTDFISQSHLRTSVSLEDYSVSNRGLRPGLVGTPKTLIERIRKYEDLGVEFLLLQASPMAEDIERLGNDVLPYV